MDQQKYINTYVDKSIGMLHEYVNMVIQLRTQLHIANDLIQEKDQVISSLQEDNDKNKAEEDKINAALASAKGWEDNYNAMKNKVGHMDTLTAQLNETKNMLLAKTQEVNSLRAEIEQLRNPRIKKAINTKKEKSVDLPRKETDDF